MKVKILMEMEIQLMENTLDPEWKTSFTLDYYFHQTRVSPVRAAATEGGNSGAPELRSSFLWKYTDTRRMGGDGSTGVWYRT